MKIQTVFEAFEQFQLGKDSLEQLLINIEAALGRVRILFSDLIIIEFWRQVDREDLPSKCKSVAGIDRMLLGELEKHIEP